MALTDKITLRTKVVDEYGSPLNANIWIDRIKIAQTNNDGSVTIPGIADSFSEVKVTHVGFKDYVISAVFLPAKVILKYDINDLDEVVITVPKKTTTTSESSSESKKNPINWLLWISIFGAAIQVKKYFEDQDKNKVVKTKI